MAGRDRLPLDLARVGVVRGALRQRRQRVRRHARPRRDLDVGTDLERFRAEVCPPFPEQDGGVDRATERVHPEGFVASVDDRPDVAGQQFIDGYKKYQSGFTERFIQHGDD